jgi:hypothetical protein
MMATPFWAVAQLSEKRKTPAPVGAGVFSSFADLPFVLKDQIVNIAAALLAHTIPPFSLSPILCGEMKKDDGIPWKRVSLPDSPPAPGWRR